MKKTTNKKILKKMTAYSTGAGAVLALCPTVSGQIIHHDIDPDTIAVDGLDFMLDVDDNAANDFTFKIFTSSTYFSSSSFYGYNRARVLNHNNNNAVLNISGRIDTISPGDTIQNAMTQTWATGLYQSLGFYGTQTSVPYTNGNFLGQNNKIMGFKLVTATDTMFGWIRLDVSTLADTIRIKEYAYNTCNNGYILAGDTVGMVTGHPDADIADLYDIYSYGKKVFVYSKELNGEIRITDINGKEIHHSRIVNSYSEISLGHLPAGVYNAAIRNREGVLNRKVVIE